MGGTRTGGGPSLEYTLRTMLEEEYKKRNDALKDEKKELSSMNPEVCGTYEVSFDHEKWRCHAFVSEYEQSGSPGSFGGIKYHNFKLESFSISPIEGEIENPAAVAKELVLKLERMRFKCLDGPNVTLYKPKTIGITGSWEPYTRIRQGNKEKWKLEFFMDQKGFTLESKDSEFFYNHWMKLVNVMEDVVRWYGNPKKEPKTN